MLYVNAIIATNDEFVPQNFHEFDKNQDHVIDSDEFGAMLDQVMKEL